MNKVSVLYRLESYKTITYEVDDSILEGYIEYCEKENIDQNLTHNLLYYLYNSDVNTTEEVETIDEELEDCSQIIKCIKRANDIRRSKTEISGDNSEAE